MILDITNHPTGILILFDNSKKFVNIPFINDKNRELINEYYFKIINKTEEKKKKKVRHKHHT